MQTSIIIRQFIFLLRTKEEINKMCFISLCCSPNETTSSLMNRKLYQDVLKVGWQVRCLSFVSSCFKNNSKTLNFAHFAPHDHCSYVILKKLEESRLRWWQDDFKAKKTWIMSRRLRQLVIFKRNLIQVAAAWTNPPLGPKKETDNFASSPIPFRFHSFLYTIKIYASTFLGTQLQFKQIFAPCF